MLIIENLKTFVEEIRLKFQPFLSVIEEKKMQLKNHEIQLENDWHNVERAMRMKELTTFINHFDSIQQHLRDFNALIELFDESGDATLVPELEAEKAHIEKESESFYIRTLLSGEYDGCNAIVSIVSGAGGTESNDWADMLLRMYTRYCEQNDFKYEVKDSLAGDVGGIKSVTFNVSGINAFGMLKSENGVHRLIRISPFDSNSRRHTSFAAVEVVPVIEKTDFAIDDKDLRIDTYRSSGAGGQHVNKTESAVRITHIPTGIVVQCQNGRSQIQNRESAMRDLKSRLAYLQREAEKQNLKSIAGAQRKIEWGSQIRSYVLCPYTMVKDHRTGAETSNVTAVLDGDIKIFINDYLLGKKNEK